MATTRICLGRIISERVEVLLCRILDGLQDMKENRILPALIDADYGDTDKSVEEEVLDK